jgi:transposase-like protein
LLNIKTLRRARFLGGSVEKNTGKKNVTPIFNYPMEIRRVIYTTKAIESLNRSLRGVILLFNEANSLFGKRSDVSDSKDRYANMEHIILHKSLAKLLPLFDK